MAEELVFGINAVAELLQSSPKRINSICFQSDSKNARLVSLLDTARALSVNVRAFEPSEFKNILASHQLVNSNHQGVIALARPSQVLDDRWLEELVQATDQPLLLVLDGVTDPHNLGACMRSACAAGADALIIPRDKSASLTPVVRKVASGAAELLPLVAVKNLARTLQMLQKSNVWVMGAAGEAGKSLYELD